MAVSGQINYERAIIEIEKIAEKIDDAQKEINEEGLEISAEKFWRDDMALHYSRMLTWVPYVQKEEELTVLLWIVHTQLVKFERSNGTVVVTDWLRENKEDVAKAWMKWIMAARAKAPSLDDADYLC